MAWSAQSSALAAVAGLAATLCLGEIGPGAQPARATPLNPTAQELGAYAMARALTLCLTTRQGMGVNRSRSLAREILTRSGFDPDGAWVKVAPATEALAEDLYKGLSPQCEITADYVKEAARRAATTFQGPRGAAAGTEPAPK